MIQEIVEYYQDENILKADGFDGAVIGIDENSMRLVYSVKLCIEKLITEGMSMEDAIDYFNFNVSGAYLGEKTPIWCHDMFEF